MAKRMQDKESIAGSMLLPKWWFQGLPALLLAW